MKTIGTVINTIVVVFGMLCSLIAGTFLGYSIAMDKEYGKHRASKAYIPSEYTRGHRDGYKEGMNDTIEAYGALKEEEKNENNA